MKRLLPRYWLTRFMIAVLSGGLCSTILMEPESITAIAIERSGAPGFWILRLAVLTCFLAFADVIINDLAPDSMQMTFTKNHRHIIYISLGLALASFSFVIAFEAMRFRGACVTYLLLSGFSFAVTFLDLFSRHDERKRRDLFNQPEGEKWQSVT